MTVQYSYAEQWLPQRKLATVRTMLWNMGAPPRCVDFKGCVRLLYTAARQMEIRITVRKQPDGSYRVWKLPKQAPQ